MSKQWFVLVGISRYRSRTLPALPGVAADLALLERTLADHHAFAEAEFVVLRDRQASAAAILQALRRAAQRAGPEDQVLVHLAGHAVMETHGREAALLAHDGARIRAGQLAGALNRGRARDMVLFLDCCNAGGLAAQLPNPFSERQARRNWFVGNVSAAGRQCFETAEGGLFAAPFCSALRGDFPTLIDAGVVTVQQAFARAQTEAQARAADLGLRLDIESVQRGHAIAFTGPPPAPTGYFKRALILEDEAFGVELGAFMASERYEVTRVQTLAEFRAYLAAGQRPDVALLDIYLADDAEGQGLQALGDLRQCAPFVPTLVLSRHLDDNLLFRVGRAGADAVLRKPLSARAPDFQAKLQTELDKLRTRRDDWSAARQILVGLDAHRVMQDLLVPLYHWKGGSSLNTETLPDGAPILTFELKDQLDRVTSNTVLLIPGNLTAQPAPEGRGSHLGQVLPVVRRLSRRSCDTILVQATGDVFSGAEKKLLQEGGGSGRLAVRDGFSLLKDLKSANLLHLVSRRFPHPVQALFLRVVVEPAAASRTWADVWPAFWEYLRWRRPDLYIERQRALLERALGRDYWHTLAGIGNVADAHDYDSAATQHLCVILCTDPPLAWRPADPRPVPLVSIALFAAASAASPDVRKLRYVRYDPLLKLDRGAAGAAPTGDLLLNTVRVLTSEGLKLMEIAGECAIADTLPVGGGDHD